ncbi:MAG TPA: phage tail tape measure protein [Solirubrobacter sp.]|nr:phage tail tape measure protein [Solirubrobacter sp.]
MSDVKAKIEIEAGTSRLPAALRQGLGYIKNFAEEVGKVGASVVKSTALGFIHGVGMSVANRGLDLMIDQGKKVIDFQRELTRLGIDLNKQPFEMQQIGDGIREISNQTGLGADQVLAAGRDYADLAGLQAFTMERMSLIARAAQASGSDVKDMAALMFTLTENMKVPDSQLEDTIGGLINQAKFGSIHFRELAKELVALGSVYSQFGVTGREGAIQIGAQMQLARHGFASASEAATGILRIYRSLPQHASKFAAANVHIWKDGSKTVMRPFEDIIKQIQNSRLALDREALIKSFGRTEGERFYQVLTALTDQYNEMKKAGEANGVVARDLGTYTESAAGRIDVATERMKNGFAQALTPERIDQIVGGIESIVAAVPDIVNAISTAMDAFSGMVHLFRSAGDSFSGIRHYAYTPEERLAIEHPEVAAETGIDLSGVDVAGAKRKAQQYEADMNDILSQESATGPTRVSIEHAVRDMLSGPNAGSRAAGSAYLKDRDIPDYIIRSTMARIANEGGGVRDMGDVIRDAVKNGMLEAMRHPSIAGPTVNLDGNKVSDGIGNASNTRRR